jgi:hypothetical protein
MGEQLARRGPRPSLVLLLHPLSHRALTLTLQCIRAMLPIYLHSRFSRSPARGPRAHREPCRRTFLLPGLSFLARFRLLGRICESQATR